MNEKKREENAKKDPIVGDYFDELNGRVDASDYYTQVYGQGAESNDEEIDYDKAKHKSNKKTAKKIVALATAVLMASIMFNTARHLGKNVELKEYLRETYGTVLSDNTFRTQDLQGYGYDTDSIAKYIQDQEDFDTAFYGVCSQINFNVNGNRNAILSEIKDGQGNPIYDNFEDYLSEKGFANEDEYQDKMNELIFSQINESKSK